MAHYTKLRESDIVNFCNYFNVGELYNYSVLSGGSENTNYSINTTEGKFIVTICETKSKHDAGILAKLLLHLDDHGFKTNKVIVSENGKYFSEHNGKPVLMRSFIEGRIIERLPDYHLNLIGKLMGLLHRIPSPSYMPKKFSYGIETFELLEGDVGLDSFNCWMKLKNKYCGQAIKSNLPKCLIHGDIFADNVVIDENGIPFIIDFEEACHYYRVFDLGMAAVGLCRFKGRIDLQMFSSLLKGYIQNTSLIEEEKQSMVSFIVYAAVATGYWRYRQFNILNRAESMVDHYKEMSHIADWVQENEIEITQKIMDTIG